ncbi:TetR family transcriptional regulator [Kaistia dalseonensis]|uniref:AcrR family transcriptional regulator n=1 Tax=Kaistia dalseonensis TaxID=410840 RepID=A0ABU0H8L8_9HYPH|nr:TetR family transcriptional regulator [Kaistia dalseonensis]MCX5496050.1 TetR family transcriptional regulator [Kaistia dalseonensis]MDQ0438654.1 AcrR family transcriptional regulator [Kaistia dalseonensis]
MRRTKSESEETRQRILDAAETVFLENGVSGTSLERIAKAAAVTRGAIYWHFSDKQELFAAMIERVRTLHGCLIERELTGMEDPLTFIAGRAYQIVNLFESDAHMRLVYKIIVTRCEYVGEMQEALVLQRSLHETMISVFRRAFDVAEANGELGREWTAETATATLTCFLSGMLNDWLRYELTGAFPDTMRRSLKCLAMSFRSGCVQAPPTSEPSRVAEPAMAFGETRTPG